MPLTVINQNLNNLKNNFLNAQNTSNPIPVKIISEEKGHYKVEAMYINVTNDTFLYRVSVT